MQPGICLDCRSFWRLLWIMETNAGSTSPRTDENLLKAHCLDFHRAHLCLVLRGVWRTSACIWNANISETWEIFAALCRVGAADWAISLKQLLVSLGLVFLGLCCLHFCEEECELSSPVGLGYSYRHGNEFCSVLDKSHELQGSHYPKSED